MHPKARFARPSLALVVLAPFVGEILSSNVPASLFFRRPIMILFAALTYSIPVLLIRELAVARRLSHPGLLIWGLAYGIFNEGILARTLLMSEGLPIPTFNHYFSVLGLNVAWAITLLVWHALFSVATPVLVVHWLWPDQADTRWLSKGWIIVALGVIGLTSLLFFRADEGPPPSGRYFLAFVGTIIALIGLGATWTGGVARGFALSWRAASPAGCSSFSSEASSASPHSASTRPSSSHMRSRCSSASRGTCFVRGMGGHTALLLYRKLRLVLALRVLGEAALLIGRLRRVAHDCVRVCPDLSAGSSRRASGLVRRAAVCNAEKGEHEAPSS